MLLQELEAGLTQVRSDTEMQSNWKFLGVIRVLSGSDEDQTVAFTWSKTNDYASGVALCTF